MDNEIMLEKFKTLPELNKRLKFMYMVNVEKSTMIAFERVGYTPSKTIKKAIDKAWANSDRNDYLYEFVYKVWEADV